MSALNLELVAAYIESNIDSFHRKRLEGLEKLKLKSVLRRKNPYLFKAKNLTTAEQIVKGLTDAHISSNEETVFGNWLEGLAIFVNHEVYGGSKSGILGIDLEFNRDGIRYIVAIKSGPNWGNSSQIAKLQADFSTAKRTLRTSDSNIKVEAVNGCCYGRDDNPDKGNYSKYCGQRFWEFISGDSGLYTAIIEPLGYRAQAKNEEFNVLYAQMINRFTKQFMNIYCMADGQIDWEKLVRVNSAIDPPI